MDKERMITIIDPDGKESTVEYVTEFELDGNNYLVYNKGEETEEEIDCYIVKLVEEKGEYIIEDIEDDKEYAKVTQKLDELIAMEVEE